MANKNKRETESYLAKYAQDISTQFQEFQRVLEFSRKHP